MSTLLTECRWLTLVISVILFVEAWNCQAQPSSATKPPVQLVLKSALLSEARRVLVRLPRLYELDTAARYPVLYKLDGDNQLEHYESSVDMLASMTSCRT